MEHYISGLGQASIGAKSTSKASQSCTMTSSDGLPNPRSTWLIYDAVIPVFSNNWPCDRPSSTLRARSLSPKSFACGKPRSSMYLYDGIWSGNAGSFPGRTLSVPVPSRTIIFRLTNLSFGLTCQRGAGLLASMTLPAQIVQPRAAPYVRRLQALHPTDFVQTRMTVPGSLLARLHSLKRQNGLRTRDAVIGSMLRLARTQHCLSEFQLPPEPPESDPMQPITAEVEAEQLEFLFRLQRKFRGAALGAVFEAVASVITDLSPPVQLELAGLNDRTTMPREDVPVCERTPLPGHRRSRTSSGASRA